MVALLHYIYDLPYDKDFETGVLKPYAMAYIVADKYQVKGLQLAASNTMKHILESSTEFEGDDVEDGIRDFLDTLEVIIINTTTHDKYARKVLVEACAMNLQFLRQEPALLSLLSEFPDLGVEIIGHPNLPCEMGYWRCTGDCEGKCTLLCEVCYRPFGKAYSWRNREEIPWHCEFCLNESGPMCSKCGERVQWRSRGFN